MDFIVAAELDPATMHQMQQTTFQIACSGDLVPRVRQDCSCLLKSADCDCRVSSSRRTVCAGCKSGHCLSASTATSCLHAGCRHLYSAEQVCHSACHATGIVSAVAVFRLLALAAKVGCHATGWLQLLENHPFMAYISVLFHSGRHVTVPMLQDTYDVIQQQTRQVNSTRGLQTPQTSAY